MIDNVLKLLFIVICMFAVYGAGLIIRSVIDLCTKNRRITREWHDQQQWGRFSNYDEE